MMKFQEANFQSIIEELSSLFIPPIVEFYGECLRIIKEQTAKLLTNYYILVHRKQLRKNKIC